MKILFLQWKGIGNEDMAEAFKALGHVVDERFFNIDFDRREEDKKEEEVLNIIREVFPDCVFSFNYFPIYAKACKGAGIPYISWTYDSPYVNLYHCSLVYPTNHVFVFDSSIFYEFHNGGINNVHYLPMAANTERLKKMTDMASFLKTNLANKTPVSFVGSLYDEKHNFFDRMDGLSDYTRGFLNAIINAQKKVYGYNFIQNILRDNPDVLAEMKRSYDIGRNYDGIETDDFLYAQYFVNRKITAAERKEQLSLIASKYGLDLYTHNRATKIDGCINHGPVDFYDKAPYVFKASKININISLRSIINGIPLRCFDIMGSGGFLLSNYQQDFLNHFVPDEDFVYYDSINDMMNKIEYYLKNESERKEIAENGFRKIESEHTYLKRAEEMLSYI